MNEEYRTGNDNMKGNTGKYGMTYVSKRILKNGVISRVSDS